MIRLEAADLVYQVRALAARKPAEASDARWLVEG
jgi:hypothetical protein